MTKLPGQPTRASTTGRPVMVLLDALGKRWALRLIWELKHHAPITFRELQGRCEDVSPTSLNMRLKDLRALGLIERVENGYALSEHGRSLSQLLTPLAQWADEWADFLARDKPPS